jgi:hypothetical protein
MTSPVNRILWTGFYFASGLPPMGYHVIPVLQHLFNATQPTSQGTALITAISLRRSVMSPSKISSAATLSISKNLPSAISWRTKSSWLPGRFGGSELCRQIARVRPRAIVEFKISETALFHLKGEVRRTLPRVSFHAEIASIQNPGASPKC